MYTEKLVNFPKPVINISRRMFEWVHLDANVRKEFKVVGLEFE